MVGGSDGRWIDIVISRHVCYGRVIFMTCSNIEDKKVLLGDAHTTNVAEIVDVELNFPSRKTLILKDVMHVYEITKNLVSSFLLSKTGFSQSIGKDLYTITKNGIFVGKGYDTNGMFGWMLIWIKFLLMFTLCVILVFDMLDFATLVNKLFLI